MNNLPEALDILSVLRYNMFSDRVAVTCEVCDRGSFCGSSLFYWRTYGTAVLTIEQQINKLEQEKGLLIPDHAYAETVLQEIGYFSLINGYKEPFKNPTTKKHRDGTTFHDIVALYKFDENLRELFLKYILRIERHIRSLLSYHFSAKHGENQNCYLEAANYSTDPRKQREIQRLVSMLSSLVQSNTDYPYINHHRQAHHNIPLWVLVNCITFGSLSKFYALTAPDIQVKISKNFASVNEKQLEQYLSVITKFRNVCAHNERLFSYKTRNDIPDTVLHQKLNIPQQGSQFIYGKRDLFSIVIAFRYLLSAKDFRKFKQALTKIIRHYFNSSSALTDCTLYELMGFPANWNKISTYRK